MSKQLHRKRLKRILFLIRHQQLKSTLQGAVLLECHRSTIERLLKQLRKEAHDINYDRTLKRYVIQKEVFPPPDQTHH